GFDAAWVSGLRMQANPLASMQLVSARNRCRVQLAVQPAPRLMGDQMQRPTLGRSAAEPFRRRQPCRMRRTVRVAEVGDGLRRDLDLSGRRLERVKLRIAAE